MTQSDIPDLTFSQIAYSRSETPWDLSSLLFKGGAQAAIREVSQMISAGLLGPMLRERLPLVRSLHDVLAADLVGGLSRHSTGTKIKVLRRFYSWIDEHNGAPTIDNVEDLYADWTESLLNRRRLPNGLRDKTIYMSANIVANLIKKALDLAVSPSLKTRIKRNSVGRDWISPNGEKQNLQTSFLFGQTLLDICRSLSAEAIWGTLPIMLHFRSGEILEEWSGLRPISNLKTLKTEHRRNSDVLIIKAKRKTWEEEKSFRTRHSVLNLRIEAELLIFIAQTGMNLAQAYKLKIGKYSYQSYSAGYQVRRVFKNRRKGEAEFSIYSEYRALFEQYLKWRNSIFSSEDTDLLFPLITPQGRSLDIAPTFSGIKKKCRLLGIEFISPRTLRLTRTNWLMRQTRNVAMVSEINQHSPATLLASYDRPSHQIAAVEIARFFDRPNLSAASPGPGACSKESSDTKPYGELSNNIPASDCINPAGCLFCDYHRDIDSADHMWSLASYRHLKSLELSKYHPPKDHNTIHPAANVIKRISDKLLLFTNSSPVRKEWIAESNARVAEGTYHPQWEGFIQMIEIQHGY